MVGNNDQCETSTDPKRFWAKRHNAQVIHHKYGQFEMIKRSKLEIASWAAAIVAALISLYSVFVPTTAEQVRQNVTQGSGNYSTQIGSVSGDVTVVQNATPQEIIDIRGRWDVEAAQQIAYGLLRAEQRRNPASVCRQEEPCVIRNSLIGEYSLIYDNREVNLILIASISENDDCHACSPHINLFEFERRKGGWALVQSDIAAFQWGSWGSMDAAHVKVQPIGNNVYGVFFELGYTQGGYTDLAVAVWAKLADSYRKILHIPSGQSDSGKPPEESGNINWKARFIVQPGTMGLFDIVVTCTGVWLGEPINTNTLFFFDGIEYRAETLPEYLLPIDCIKKSANAECSPSGGLYESRE